MLIQMLLVVPLLLNIPLFVLDQSYQYNLVLNYSYPSENTTVLAALHDLCHVLAENNGTYEEPLSPRPVHAGGLARECC